MICFNCGKNIKENICPYCGKVIKKTANDKDYNKISKNIIYIFISIIIFILIICTIIYIDINNESEKKQNDFVHYYCNKNYVNNILISNVIDSYSCENYASYMYDTNGSELNYSQIEKLLLNNDINIFKIYYDITGKDISNIYDDIIIQNSYYEFLYKYNHTDFVNKDIYLNLISSSLDNNDFNLYKSVLNCYFKQYNDFPYPEKFFGSNEIRSNNKYIENIKNNAQKTDFVIEYKNHIDYYPLAYMFNSDLFKIAKDDKDFKRLITRSASLLSYNDIENYIKWGGKFYIENTDPILDYILYFYSGDIDAYNKINYITNLIKLDGYDIIYSNALDDFLRLYKNYDGKAYYDAYNALKANGFKCYKYCYYERNFS